MRAIHKPGPLVVDPATRFQGTTAILVPHMDDAALACGGTIAQLPNKDRVYVIYATDGRGSPSPILPMHDTGEFDLCSVRMLEAQRAMAVLGVPKENVRFLNLPDSHLRRQKPILRQGLLEQLQGVKPDHLLVPFRYDRHPDHIALNHVMLAIHRQEFIEAQIVEYFVYHRWRLLSAGDIRAYIRPNQLIQTDNSEVVTQKRAALDCFTSQTTRFFPWQTRPNLTSELLDEASKAPEWFLPYDPKFPGTAIFDGPIVWIRLAHRLEPALKQRKDQAVAMIQLVRQRNASSVA